MHGRRRRSPGPSLFAWIHRFDLGGWNEGSDILHQAHSYDALGPTFPSSLAHGRPSGPMPRDDAMNSTLRRILVNWASVRDTSKTVISSRWLFEVTLKVLKPWRWLFENDLQS